MEGNKEIEGVHTVYRDNKLVAIIKRDDVSKKRIVYKVEEATEEEIYQLTVQ